MASRSAQGVPDQVEKPDERARTTGSGAAFPGDRPVVLVTGGARRVGRGIVLELAAHGFDIALHCRASRDEAERTADEARALGARVIVVEADLADEASTRALMPAVLAAFGRADAVVHNASTFEYDDVASFHYATLERQLRANTGAAIVLAQALHEHLTSPVRSAGPDGDNQDPAPADGPTKQAPALRTGCVVHLLDQKLWNPNPDHLSYTLSKAALQAATPMLAMALAPRVRVCGVAPGVTLSSGPMDSAEFELAHRMTPLGRSSTVDDIARAVRFLIESPAITGTTLLVDGGQPLSGQPRDVLFLARQTLAAAAEAGPAS